MTDKDKYEILSLLQQEHKPKDIADDLGVSYGAVLKLRREFEDAKLNNTIDQLIDVDKLVIAEAGESIGDVVNVEERVAELTNGLEGLDRLSGELQKTAININKRVNSLLLSVETVGELDVATDILCKLQTAFLNKNLTQVNVQNNFGGDDATPKYTQYLGDKPGG